MTEFTEFFMEQTGNGIARTIAFPNGVWERGETSMNIGYVIPHRCATKRIKNYNDDKNDDQYAEDFFTTDTCRDNQVHQIKGVREKEYKTRRSLFRLPRKEVTQIQAEAHREKTNGAYIINKRQLARKIDAEPPRKAEIAGERRFFFLRFSRFAGHVGNVGRAETADKRVFTQRRDGRNERGSAASPTTAFPSATWERGEGTTAAGDSGGYHRATVIDRRYN